MRVVRFLWRALAAAAAAILLWLAGVSAVAYGRSPGMAAELERSRALPLLPAALPPARVCALLAVQDRTFFRHWGLGLFDGPLLHTTVTQSICKGLFFGSFSPGLLRHRKFMLMADALAFDRRVSKEMQLRIFINRAYFGSVKGEEVHGFEAAAHGYFGKDVGRLTDREYLGLVAMLVAPDTYHVVLRPEANAARVAALEPLVASSCRPGCIAAPPHAPCGGGP
jgi:membrane peptidoglycan carboxypeptidase